MRPTPQKQRKRIVQTTEKKTWEQDFLIEKLFTLDFDESFLLSSFSGNCLDLRNKFRVECSSLHFSIKSPSRGVPLNFSFFLLSLSFWQFIRNSIFNPRISIAVSGQARESPRKSSQSLSSGLAELWLCCIFLSRSQLHARLIWTKTKLVNSSLLPKR